MRTYIRVALMFNLLFCHSAIAQMTGPTGIWQGTLDAGGGQKLTLQFTFSKQPNGSYTAMLNSPDNAGIKNIPANVVSYKDRKLTLKVDSLSGSYSGTVGKGTISGEWRQQSKTMPLVLTQLKQLSAQDMKRLQGQWVGKIKGTDGALITVVYRFEITKDGKLTASSDSPDVGVFGSAVTDISLTGKRLIYRIPDAAGEFEGELTAQGISGTFKGQYYTGPLKLVRGKYEPPAAKVDIPAPEMKKLLGRWSGRVGTVSIVFHFDRNATGKNIITMDIPEQNVKGMAVLNASLINGTLSLKMSQLEYSGKLSGNKIDGSMKPPGQNAIPLLLTRE